MSRFSAILLGVTAIAGVANAHFVMSHPEPYAFASLPNGPIDPASPTSMFPCAGASGKTDMPAGGATPMTAGGAFPVNFTGSAVHGGGSCQFSVTYEMPPPADPSKWKVIHSTIGGCPASAAGNLKELPADQYGHAQGVHCPAGQEETGYECVRSYAIDIPKQLKNGPATFAWTWFNRLGNREMYMNCAPVEITGGSEEDGFLDTLPEIFVANAKTVMGEATCGTLDGISIQTFPNPGLSVTTDLSSPQGGDFTTQEAPSACKYGRAGSAGNADANTGADSDSDADKPVASPVASAAPVASANPGAVFAPGAGAASSAAPVVPVPSPSAAPVAPAPVVSAAPVVPAPSAAPVAGSNTSVACPTDGAIVCISATQFGLCDHGFAVPQALAAGTSCTGGVISKRSTTHKHLGAHKRRMANLL